jgi:hypothetical protein
MALIVFCFGAVRPLADPDLPMHLAVGEWIVHHKAVPFVEPFAWTRRDAPYFAYSWLPQTVYYLVLRTFGHLGLRALNGFVVAGGAAAILVLARAARWRASQAVILAGLNIIVGSFFVAYLRPQSILLITFPLLWAGCFLVMRGKLLAGATLTFVASAATANSHLFFPLTIAPAALLWTERTSPERRRQAFVVVASVLAGWLTSPYSLHWFSVFRHNFGPNPLYGPPAAITELQPGFVALLHPKLDPMLALVLAMFALPWILGQAPLNGRQRFLSALYWAGGAILFGFATRLFVAWWVLSLVSVGWALDRMTHGTSEGPPRLQFRLLLLVSAAVIVAGQLVKTSGDWKLEGDTVHRSLPTVGARPAERLAAWLLDSARAGSRGRIATTFTFGSYLDWRLPGYSASIDSRGVFPDSVSGAEGVVLAFERDVPDGPWRSADLAIIPFRYRAAAALDTATGWRRLASVPDVAVPADSVGLWAREGWWALSRRAGAPARLESR